MSGPEFFQTPMGKRFYEHTLPELVKQLGRLADLGERALPLVEAVVRPAQPRASASPEAPSSAPTCAPSPRG
jgi:hypothetical protein